MILIPSCLCTVRDQIDHHGRARSATRAVALLPSPAPPVSVPAHAPDPLPSSQLVPSAWGDSPETAGVRRRCTLFPRDRIQPGKTDTTSSSRASSRTADPARRTPYRSARRAGVSPPRARAGRGSRRRWDSSRCAQRTDTRACAAGCTRADIRI